MKKVILYTDGACSGNPGAGGWGCVLIEDGEEKQISGYDPNTTNNKMELTAVIMGLKSIDEPSEVEVHSDSAYVLNAFLQDWIGNWQRNGWRNADKQPVKNADLWRELISLSNYHKITWIKVRGHAGDKYNEICDSLATSEVEKNNQNSAG